MSRCEVLLVAVPLLMLAVLRQSACAADPVLETTALFEAGKGGYASYRIPSLAVTPKGTVLAFCEARRSTKGDWGAIDILLVRGVEGGKTWSPPIKVAEVAGPHQKNPVALKQKLAAPGDVTSNNPLVIVDEVNGTIHLLFCLEYMRCFHRQSDDDGATFSPAVEITAAFEELRATYPWSVLATGPGHGICLSGGRLLAPIWLSSGTGGHAHRPSVIATLYSDDRGGTWHAGQIAAQETDPLVNPSESVAVELADGRVLLNMRHETPTHRRAVATSADGASGWTRPVFDQQLVEPICMASMCRLSTAARDGKNRILFANPDNLSRADGQEVAGKSRDRKNLSIRLSYDEGQNWPVSKPLDPGTSGYCDLAVGPDGTIYCLYERGGRDAKSAYAPGLTLARFNLEWLSDGRDMLKPRPH